MDRDRIRALFLEELEDLTGALGRGLLELERHPHDRDDVLKDLFRAAHSLKGAAQAAGIAPVAALCHRFEDVFGGWRAGTLAVQPGMFEPLLAAIDALEGAANQLREGREPEVLRGSDVGERLRVLLSEAGGSGPGAPGEVRPEQTPHGLPGRPTPAGGTSEDRCNTETLRISSAKLDALMGQADAVTLSRQRVAAVVARIGQLGDVVARHDRHWRRLAAALGDAFSPEAAAAFERTQGSWRAAAELLNRLDAEARAAERGLRQAGGLLDRTVRGLRMLPFAQVCEGLERVVRDLTATAGDGSDHGKRVDLVVDGGAVELDRPVAVGLREPLIHLVRNAVDHGIEPAVVRRSAGKPEAGRVAVVAEPRGERLEVSVSDDGGGLDLGSVRAAAQRRGLPPPDDAAGLARIVFTAGLSTAPSVTDVSGRGVGLDAVRARVEALGGTVSLASQPGTGMTVTMAVSLTLSTIHAVLVSVAGQTLALPSAAVARVVRVGADDLKTVDGREALVLEGRPIPVLSLAHTLALPDDGERRPGERIPALIIGSAGNEAALTVTAILGEQRLTVRSLGERLAGASDVLGVTLLPTGGAALILNAAAWVRRGLDRVIGASHAEVLAPLETAARRRVLLVEDSLTTRSLEQGILEAAGYEVVHAVDGAQAWQLLQERGADVVVSDVNMPRMDGLALCEAIRRSNRFRDLPVVLVTSLAGDEDRRRGIDVGANAYVVKSGFDQQTLVDVIDGLL